MINYRLRCYDKELLDANSIPFADIAQNMKELEFINAHLGGHAITINGFKKLLKGRKKISVCEIGCGGGDNLAALNSYCKQKNIDATFTGIDSNEDCIRFAIEKNRNKNFNFIADDFRKIIFSEKPDIIFSSLFCHHFTDDELVQMMQWMKYNSNAGFFINDLHRHPMAYHFIKTATRFFSKSYLVKNDAPLSVLRGFKKNEWQKIFLQAGIHNYLIQWKWAFRYLVIVLS
jgi:2-polyprenyl-3-methyl-5-hydroxy-6-metoxy-1,4-benzoquinol methylase